ncbi:MAG TPA: ATP-binding protein [Jiangellaceae bacterium]|nr:ATP-binding protein [Jiangellaceae bacterium]
MDASEIDDFGRLFGEFLAHVVEPARGGVVGRESIVERVESFLAADPATLPVVTEDFRAFEHATIQIAIERLLDAPNVRHDLVGIGGGGRAHQSFSEILEMSRQHRAFWLGAVDYAAVPVSPDNERTCVSLGLYLIEDGELGRLAVLLRGANPQYGQAAMLEVIAATTGDARAWLSKLRDERVRSNTLRGQVLSFEPSQFAEGAGPVRFIRRPHLGRDDVIMPDGLLERIERQVVGIAEHRDRLRAEGRHLKRGVLLYGPPGTGKTHTVRYLTAALRKFTVILLAGPAIQFVTEACTLARTLQPSLIVLEDCDLVASDRSFSPSGQPLLFSILDEMDGLGSDADVCFLLTTNRVDLIETALAQRPGRVDLACEIPLPDDEGRQRLLDLYGAGIELTADDVAAVVARTSGVPASFMKELTRRATLLSAARGGERTTAADIRNAVDELMATQETLTRRLLGTGGDEHSPAEPAAAPGGEPSGWFAYAPAAYTTRRLIARDETT